MMHLANRAIIGLAIAASVSWSGVALSGDLADFKDPFDGSKLSFPLKSGETETAALKKFKETGDNDYRKDSAAIAKGKELYDQWCQLCHNADGSGKMGPSLISNDPVYKQRKTDPGMFSIIYAGASGAMQAFSKRELTQDDMLKIIAYVRTLEKK
ncbi:MAG: c-type cytochrome [Burkholderiales bacterium]